MITLYDLGLSGNCHKIRLLLSMLDLPFKTVAMNLAAGDHRQPAYLALNPFGQVPTLPRRARTSGILPVGGMVATRRPALIRWSSWPSILTGCS